MSCEEARETYEAALAGLLRMTRELESYASRLGPRLGDEPSLLLGGDVRSWQRYASEVETSAAAHRQSLDRLLEEAVQHEELAS